VIGDPYFDLDVTRLRFSRQLQPLAGWCRFFEAHDFLPKPYVPHTGWPITRAAIEPFFPETFEILGIQPFTPDLPVSADLRQFDLIKSDHVHFGEKFLPELARNPNIAVVLNTEVSALMGNGRSVTARNCGRRVRRPARSRSIISSSQPAAGEFQAAAVVQRAVERRRRAERRPRSAATGWSTRCTRAARPSSPTPTRSPGRRRAGVLSPTPEAMAERGILNSISRSKPIPIRHQGLCRDLACLVPEDEWYRTAQSTLADACFADPCGVGAGAAARPWPPASATGTPARRRPANASGLVMMASPPVYIGAPSSSGRARRRSARRRRSTARWTTAAAWNSPAAGCDDEIIERDSPAGAPCDHSFAPVTERPLPIKADTSVLSTTAMLGLRASSGRNFSPKCTWSLLIRSNWRRSAETADRA